VKVEVLKKLRPNPHRNPRSRECAVRDHDGGSSSGNITLTLPLY
jgi:hypothetical protein